MDARIAVETGENHRSPELKALWVVERSGYTRTKSAL